MGKIPLLDLGNVVVKVDFSPFLEWLASRVGHGDVARVEPLLRSSLFYDFEFGQVRPEEFARRLSRLYGAELARGELEEKFCSVFPGLVEGMEPLLEEMAGSGPVYCLTNTNEVHLSHLRARFPLLGRFTRVFASHEIGRRKPYPGVYRDVARELSCRPSDLLFFDDSHANVRGALKAGLQAHVFAGVEAMRPLLKGRVEMDDNGNEEA